MGNSSQIASSAWLVICRPPRCVYEVVGVGARADDSSPLSDWLM